MNMATQPNRAPTAAQANMQEIRQAPPMMPTGGKVQALNFQNLEDMHRFAKYASSIEDSGAWYCKKPFAALLAIQRGAELGLTAMASLETIAVINGRTCVWGDGLLAVCRASPFFDEAGFVREEIGKRGTPSYGWRVTAKRRNGKPETRTFTVEDATTAKAWDKRAGKMVSLIERETYKSYPQRMLMRRATSWVLHDVFPDVLGGLYSADEMIDSLIDQIDTSSLDRKTPSQIEAEILAEPTFDTDPEILGPPCELDDPRLEENQLPEPEAEDDPLRVLRASIVGMLTHVNQKQTNWCMKRFDAEIDTADRAKLEALENDLRACIEKTKSAVQQKRADETALFNGSLPTTEPH